MCTHERLHCRYSSINVHIPLYISARRRNHTWQPASHHPITVTAIQISPQDSYRSSPGSALRQRNFREDASSDCYSLAPQSTDTPLHPSRSFNVLCDKNLDGMPSGGTKWNTTYQQNSHSTSDLFEEIKGYIHSLYIILYPST